MFDNVDSRLGAANGTKRLSAAAHTDLEVSGVIPEVDAVVSVCSATDEKGTTIIDLTAAPYNWGALTAGIPYYAPIGFKITTITVDSGTLASY